MLKWIKDKNWNPFLYRNIYNIMNYMTANYQINNLSHHISSSIYHPIYQKIFTIFYRLYWFMFWLPPNPKLPQFFSQISPQNTNLNVPENNNNKKIWQISVDSFCGFCIFLTHSSSAKSFHRHQLTIALMCSFNVDLPLTVEKCMKVFK